MFQNHDLFSGNISSFSRNIELLMIFKNKENDVKSYFSFFCIFFFFILYVSVIYAVSHYISTSCLILYYFKYSYMLYIYCHTGVTFMNVYVRYNRLAWRRMSVV